MDLLDQINEQENTRRAAYIKYANENAAFEVQTFVLDLSTARTENNPFVIGFPFKSIVFEEASDNTVSVNCKFNSNDAGVSVQKYKDNASVVTDRIFSKAFISHAAQSGKSIRVTVYLNAKYESGALINSGTVNVTTPTTATLTNPALSATTATLLAASSASTKRVTVFNNDTETLFVGFANTITNSGATSGIPVPAGASIEFENQSAVWGYSVGGASVGQIQVVVES